MSNNIYNILGKLKALTESAEPAAPEATVYESVEARGSITEAVRSLESKYATFKEAKAKPDFLDVDKDCNKKEPFKKAVKDKKEVDEGTIAKPKKDLRKHSATAKRMAMQKKADKGHEEWLDHLEKTDPDHPSLKYRKQATNEGQGPYTLDDPKHPKFKANYEKYKKAHPDCTLAEFVAAMKKKEKGLAEGQSVSRKSADFTTWVLQQGDKFKDFTKNPDTYAAAQKAYKAAQKTMAEAAYDEPAAPDAEAIAKRKRLQAIKDRQEEQGNDYSDTKSNVRKVAGKAYGGAAQKDAEDDLDEMIDPSILQAVVPGVMGAGAGLAAGHAFVKNMLNKGKQQQHKAEKDLKNSGVTEVAPPGAKAERMVKHIKKGYAKDGNLTKKEKGIAYATAWKAKKAGQVEEGVEFKDAGKIKNSAPNMKKAKPAMVKESRVMEETDYFYEKVAKSLCAKNPHLDTAGGEFADAVRKEMIAQGIEPNRARNILLMDEDFLGDVATSYGHYCQDVAETHAPMNSHLGGAEELDEIAALAGLATRAPAIAGAVSTMTDSKDMEEDAMGAAMGGIAGGMIGKTPAAVATGAKLGSAARDTFNSATGLEEELSDEAKLERYHELIRQGMDPDDAEVEVFNDEGDEDLDEVTAPPLATPGKAPATKATGMAPAKGNIPPTPTFNEDEMAEGNEFSGALAKAKAAGAKEFEVDGKKYTVKEDINVNITANGQEDALNLFRKLAGMEEVASAQPVAQVVELPQDLESALAQGVIEPVEEERDIEYANTPNEKIGPVSAAIPSGTDLNRSKKQYRKEYPGDNPMAVREETLWKSYKNMINDIKG